MQKSMRSSIVSSKKPLSFRQAVNKLNGQMQYYEGPPKFLPSSQDFQISQLNLNSVSVTEEVVPMSNPMESQKPESQRIDLIQSQKPQNEEEKFKEMIQAQNHFIIEQQKKMQAKVKARNLFKNPSPSKEIKKNQNYTEVPQNS
jgi:hypothetical protein